MSKKEAERGAEYINTELDQLEYEENQGPVEGEYVPGPESIGPDSAGLGFDAEIKSLIQGVLVMATGFVASRRGAHWEMQPQEADSMAESCAVLIEKYLPDTKGGPELALIVSVVAYAAPRMMVDKMESAKRQEKDIGGNSDVKKDADWGEQAGGVSA